MAKKNILRTNILYNSIYNLLVIAIPLLVSPHLSRAVGVEGVGVYSFSYAVSLYFRRTALLGVEKHGSRGIAMVRDDPQKRRATFWGAYSIQFFSCLLCTLAYGLYLSVHVNDHLAALVQLIYITSAFFEVNWYFFGREDFKSVVIFMGLGKLAYLVATYAFIKTPGDIYLYIAFMGLSHWLPGLIIFVRVLLLEKFFAVHKDQLVQNLKGMLLLFIPVIAVTVYKSMDKLMIGVICDTSYENGLYENAEKILSVPLAVMTAVSGVMMPRMTKLYHDKQEKSAEAYLDHLSFFGGIVSAGAAFGMVAISEIFSDVYWGEAFHGCALLLRMFSISIPFMCLAEILRTQYIIPKKKDKYYIIAVCMGAVVNLIINALLIPGLGAEGAVIGTIVAEAAVCIYQAVVVRNEIAIKKYALQFVKYLIPGSAMCAIVSALCMNMKHTVVNLLVAVFVGVIAFSSLVLLQLGLFEKARLKMLVGAVLKKK